MKPYIKDIISEGILILNDKKSKLCDIKYLWYRSVCELYEERGIKERGELGLCNRTIYDNSKHTANLCRA